MCVYTRILNNYKLDIYFITLTIKKIRPFYSESQIPYFQNFMSTKVKAIRYPDFNLPHAKVCLGIWADWVLDSGRQKNLAVWDVLSWAGRIVSFCESSSHGERSTLKQHTVEGLLQMPMDTGSRYWSWRGGASSPLAMSLGNREGNYEKSVCDQAQGIGRKGWLQMENCTLGQYHWSAPRTDYTSSGLLTNISLQNLNIPRYSLKHKTIDCSHPLPVDQSSELKIQFDVRKIKHNRFCTLQWNRLIVFAHKFMTLNINITHVTQNSLFNSWLDV